MWFLVKKFKQVLKYISISLSILFFIATISIVLLSVKAKKNNQIFSIFGYSYSVVASPSMEPDIEVGEIIIVKKVKFDKYLENAQVGQDVLVYYSNSSKRFIVHELYQIEEGGLRLKGVNNDSPDSELVTSDNFRGIVVSHGFKWLGSLLLGSQSLILLVFMLFLVFVIGSEVISYLIRKNKKNNTALSEEEREQLRQEILDEIKKGS